MKELWSIRAQAKTTQLVIIVFGLIAIAISVYSIHQGNEAMKEAKKTIYILRNNNRLVEAVSSDLDGSYDILCKGQIEEINKHIFQQIPDPNEINKNLKKATVIGDKSVADMIDALKSNRYYNNIVSQNYFTVLLTDSISVNYATSIHPYTYYGKIKIVRNGQVYWRKIVTQGLIEYTNVRTQTDNRGFLIKDVKTIQFDNM
ncbi:hypothetical protein ACILDT_09425 [Capnocytophaga canis]|uniref:Conjugative transposon protein TraK n=1 Tax=Capnocytophaga canis TaxID=1848903 RepID=A0A0B7ILM6_9FLAO|nr:hypothetical protein [Capnocytophaga canis]CEN52745.1 hypothetical protein CCAND93_290011 [Capnocytophaga canis]